MKKKFEFSKVTLGLLMAMASLILLHNNQVYIGLPAFIVGIFLMIKKQKR